MKETVQAKKTRCSRKSTLTSLNKISHERSRIISVRELKELYESLVCRVVFLKHINNYGSEVQTDDFNFLNHWHPLIELLCLTQRHPVVEGGLWLKGHVVLCGFPFKGRFGVRWGLLVMSELYLLACVQIKLWGVVVTLEPFVILKEFWELGKELDTPDFQRESLLMLEVHPNVHVHVRTGMDLNKEGLLQAWCYRETVYAFFLMCQRVGSHTRLVAIEGVLALRTGVIVGYEGIAVVAIRYYSWSGLLCQATPTYLLQSRHDAVLSLSKLKNFQHLIKKNL